MAKTDDNTQFSSFGNSGDDQDFWAQLLAAAQTEAARRINLSDAVDNSDNLTANGPRQFVRGELLMNTYRIDSNQIDGGMGSVWKVHHIGWNVDLAMKRPQPQLFSDERSKDNFIKECQTWIDLGLHPNIVSCYYVREIEGVPTIFSEWMENGSLENRIQDGSLYEGAEADVNARLLDIAIQYARGLHYAHEKGLIHQDVKPDNLLLTGDWEAKAADFGLAKARAQLTVLEGDATLYDDAGATHMAPSGGYTPAYCSMEQMDGKLLTRRTDIYSWAVSVMEMYFGSRPWSNGVVAGMGCQSYFSAVDAKVVMPLPLQKLLARCMAADPDDRPHDFAVIEKELFNIYKNFTGKTYPRPETKAASDTADSFNNRALSYLDMGQPEKAEEYWNLAHNKEPDHAETIYNQSLYLWRRGKINGTDLIRRCASLIAGKDSGSEWQEKVRQIYAERKNSEPRSFNCQSRTVSNFGINLHHPQVCLSSDGKKIYTGFDSISCYDAVTLKEVFNRPDLVGDTLVDMLKLSSDGKYLLYHKMESYHHPTLLKDVLVNPGEAETLFIADAKTGKHLRMLTASGSYGHQKPVTAFCIHPDSTFCYTAGTDKILKWNFISGELIAEYELKKSAPGTKVGRNVFSYGTVCSIDISPDGKLLCAVILGSSSSMIAVWDEESYHLHELKEADHRISDISFSADSHVIFSCGTEGIGVWDPETLTCDLHRISVPLENMRVSPDGKSILVSDSLHNVKLLNAVTLECERVFHTSEVRIESIDASSDLLRVAAADWDRTVMIWDVNAEIPQAQWELSQIKEYGQVISQEQDAQLFKAEITAALKSENIKDSLALLEAAENRFDPHAFFPLRRRVMAYCLRKELTNVYEIASFTILEDFFELPTMLRHGSIYPHPLGNTAAVRFSREKVIQIRDDQGGKVRDIHMPEDFDGVNILSSMAYSRSGKKLAVGGYDSVLVLDAEQGTVLRELREHEEAYCFSGLGFSPDDKLLAAGTGDDHTLCLWNVDSGRLIREWKEDILCSQRIRFMPSGDRMIVSTPSNLLLYDVKTGKLIKTIPVYVGCLDFDLSPDGKKLYLFTEEGFIQMDTGSWHTDYSFQPHERNKFSATDQYRVSPDGTLLATINVGNIQLWSLEDRSLIREIPLFETVYQLEFSPDSSMLYAVCGNVVRVYALLRKLEFPGWSENTAPVDPVIASFKTACGQPDAEQVSLFLREIRNRGFGFIRPEVIKTKFRK